MLTTWSWVGRSLRPDAKGDAHDICTELEYNFHHYIRTVSADENQQRQALSELTEWIPG